MPTIQITTLFESSLFRIDEYRSPLVEPQVNEEEWTHDHSIAFIRAGTYLCNSPLGLAVANPNHALFFNKQQPYQIRRPLAAQEHTVEFIFKQQLLFDMLSLPSTSSNPDSPFRTNSTLVNARQSLYLHQLLRLINDIEQFDCLAIEELALILISDVLQLAEQLKPVPDNHRRSATHLVYQELAQHTKLVISEQFREKLSLEQIAEQVHCSPYHLSRIFKQQTGYSLYQYLQQMRLLNALSCLVDYPKLSLMMLALDLGFSSHSHFSSVFIKTFGITPSAFRQAANTQMIHEMSKNLKA